jgi:hypothetical protein
LAHWQEIIFGWVAHQGGLSGAAIFAAGLLAAFHGVRLQRLLIVLLCAVCGYGLGDVLSAWTDWPPLLVIAAATLASAATALVWPRPTTLVASGLTWALLGAYLASQLGSSGPISCALAALLGSAATVLTIIARPSMTMLLTSLHGAAWMIVGCVGITADALPVVSETFRSWASNQPLVVIVLLGMLATTAYSCQSNALRGDLRTGQLGVPPPSAHTP